MVGWLGPSLLVTQPHCISVSCRHEVCSISLKEIRVLSTARYSQRAQLSNPPNSLTPYRNLDSHEVLNTWLWTLSGDITQSAHVALVCYINNMCCMKLLMCGNIIPITEWVTILYLRPFLAARLPRDVGLRAMKSTEPQCHSYDRAMPVT